MTSLKVVTTHAVLANEYKIYMPFEHAGRGTKTEFFKLTTIMFENYYAASTLITFHNQIIFTVIHYIIGTVSFTEVSSAIEVTIRLFIATII